MSRFWKIVLLVIAVLLVAGIGYRVMGGGKQKAGARTARPDQASRLARKEIAHAICP